MILNLQLTRECCRFSELAYTDSTISSAATSTQVVVGQLSLDARLPDPGSIVVAFRGTLEPRDYLTDSKYWFKRPYQNGHVHRGFLAGVLSVLDELRISLKGESRIYFTGHSLGGAKAMIAALACYEMDFNIAGVHTFGAPRVGNGAFRNYYNAQLGNRTLRWEAQGDPIPWMPPLLHSYRHAGRAAYLKNDGRVIVEPDLVDHVPAFVESLAKTPSCMVNGFLNLFDPHYLTNYTRLLKEARE